MAENTAIEWTDHTWSPVWGCTQVSPACDHCYAMTLANRFGHGWNGAPMREFGEHHWNEPLRWNKRAIAAGRRARVFPSMCDPFDKDWPAGVRDRFWQLIAATPALDWLLLTKRIGNAAQMMSHARGGHLPLLPNVWLGVTVINQAEADRDIPKLLATPARVRFLSIEPMLGPVQLPKYGKHQVGPIEWGLGVDWVIAGGESGPGARPMHPDWARGLRDQCEAAGVPFLFKQWGEQVPAELVADPPDDAPWRADPNGRRAWNAMESLLPRDQWQRVAFWKPGKKAAGRLLDGVHHDGFPA